MILQYLSNAGEEGAKRDSIYEYLKDVLPQNKTEEQKIRMLRRFAEKYEKRGLDHPQMDEIGLKKSIFVEFIYFVEIRRMTRDNPSKFIKIPSKFDGIDSESNRL